MAERACLDPENHDGPLDWDACDRACNKGQLPVCEWLGTRGCYEGYPDEGPMCPESFYPDAAQGLAYLEKACTGGLADACVKAGSCALRYGPPDTPDGGLLSLCYREPLAQRFKIPPAKPFFVRACALGNKGACKSVQYLYQPPPSAAQSDPPH